MADPAFLDLAADAWTLVAQNVVTGKITPTDSSPQYLQTYRQTGGDAPTDKAEGTAAFRKSGEPLYVSSYENIDVYLYPIGTSGRVRVDI